MVIRCTLMMIELLVRHMIDRIARCLIFIIQMPDRHLTARVAWCSDVMFKCQIDTYVIMWFATKCADFILNPSYTMRMI